MIYPPEDNSYFLNFNLVRDPFPQDFVDKILYLTAELNHRLDTLVTRIKAGWPLQVVISPVGGGKTVIADYLTSLTEPDWLAGMVQGRPEMDIDALSQEILKKIFTDTDFEKDQAGKQLSKLLEVSTQKGKVPVFIIDDAHVLSRDCLQFILQLAAMRYEGATYRIVLFANESINDLFAEQGMKEMTTGLLKELNLPPFSPEHTRAYIENRLSLSGEMNIYPFSDDELQFITRGSAGLPGGINLLARQLMQEKTGNKSRQTHGRGRWLIAVVSVVLLSAVAAYYYYLTQELPTGAGPGKVAAVGSEQQKTGAGGKPQTATLQPETVAKSAIDKTPVNAQVSINLPEATARSVAPVVLPGSSQGVDEQPPATDVAQAEKPQAPVTIAEGGGEGRDNQQQEKTITLTPPPEQAEPEETMKTARQSVHGEQQQEQAITRAPPPEQAEPEENAATAQQAVPKAYAADNIYRLDSVPGIVKGIHGPDWFRQQSPDLFVLQLLSVSDFSNLERMLKKIPDMQGQLSGYTNYTPSGKPRYMLYYGLYTDRATAYAAIRDIPLRGVKPWPRGINSIIHQLDDLAARGYY